MEDVKCIIESAHLHVYRGKLVLVDKLGRTSECYLEVERGREGGREGGRERRREGGREGGGERERIAQGH